ncbi:hypothetical protein LIER_25513 [Lithospermum erythrorhizon]|uniref:VWFA domain-containing protein n=1 Tax=Lithospermum erythrorhizon TaxID=34254 RepID=A0AAV3R513_LITER
MADSFSSAVEEGLRLSKRLYYAVAPPRAMREMESLLPQGPMMYAVISDPGIVDNPDVPTYQPHVHGTCHPPALIPLQINLLSLETHCFFHTAFVSLEASFRLHCVMSSRSSPCLLALPMGHQGSILGVEVQVAKNSYRTKLTDEDVSSAEEKKVNPEDGGYLKPHLFTLTIPQIDGGSDILIKAKWSQKLLYNDSQFTLRIPYTLPEFVTPAGKKVSKKEKIQLNVDAGLHTEVLCKTTSHPLKQLHRSAGKLEFSYESDVLTWSKTDFIFCYAIPLGHTDGGVFLQSPGMLDSDRREMFCCYIHPGEQKSRKIFKREMIFLVDISGSMQGKPLESTKNALLSTIGKLDSQDFFNIIAFNGEVYPFSSSLEPVTTKIIESVSEWINKTFVASGGTNILAPLNQGLDMLSKCQDSTSSVILITDGAVEGERKICDIMKTKLADQKTIFPRIHTFGIGSFCNHYFLRMLSIIGRGEYDAALDQDSIEELMERLLTRVTSVVLSNITFDFHDLDDLEVYPSRVPDLSSQGYLMISGRYQGTFPPNLKVSGLLANMSSFSVDLKVQESNDILLNKVVAKQQIDVLTAKAWFSEDRELKEKIAKISLQYAVVSEYTRMILIEIGKGKSSAGSSTKQVMNKIDPQNMEESKQQKIRLLQPLVIGFGDISATIDNIPPGCRTKPQEATDIIAKAASDCCGKLCDVICCMCCIRACSGLNDQCAIAMAQLCGALACLGCYVCCGGGK